jgi:hypothetical protein
MLRIDRDGFGTENKTLQYCINKRFFTGSVFQSLITLEKMRVGTIA